jgi:hypothetical protein
MNVHVILRNDATIVMLSQCPTPDVQPWTNDPVLIFDQDDNLTL